MDIKRILRTKLMPIILKDFWYVNASGRQQLKEIFCTADFVRFSQIEKILMNSNLPEGDIAELGVYKGRLTRLLAKVCYLKHKQLFLFDTFNGFNKADLECENLEENIEDFSDTNADKVMNICIKKGMRQENIKMKVGWFPESFDEEVKNAKFAFVSIDFDLYKPIKSALELLYDNVVEDGWIVVHDYGNKNYEGARKAVNEFIAEQKIKYVFELCDYCGSIFIQKKEKKR